MFGLVGSGMCARGSEWFGGIRQIVWARGITIIVRLPSSGGKMSEKPHVKSWHQCGVWGHSKNSMSLSPHFRFSCPVSGTIELDACRTLISSRMFGGPRREFLAYEMNFIVHRLGRIF